MDQWRWTVTDNVRPVVRQESGQSRKISDAMNDVSKCVEQMSRDLVFPS